MNQENNVTENVLSTEVQDIPRGVFSKYKRGVFSVTGGYKIRNYEYTTVKELLVACATTIASGKERKYVWRSIDAEVTEMLNGILDTWCAIFDAQLDSDQIEVGRNFYDVCEYEIPTEEWATKILNFSKYVAMSERSFSKKKFRKVSCLENTYNPDNVLSPVGLKEAYSIFHDYNKFKTTSAVSKERRKLTEYEGFLTSDDAIVEILTEESFVYDRTFVAALEIRLDSVYGFGEKVEMDERKTLVESLVGVDSDGKQGGATTTTGSENSGN